MKTLKELKVGDPVVVRHRLNQDHDDIVTNVEKIGSKYITVRGQRFDKETGEENSTIGYPDQLYASMQELLDEDKKALYIRKIKNAFEYNYPEPYTLDQLTQVIKILNIK